MKTESVDKLFQFAVNKEMLKKSVGDGPEFEILYEALLGQIKENSPSVQTSEDGEQTIYNPVSTKAGGTLQDIPMRIKGEGITVNKTTPIDIVKTLGTDNKTNSTNNSVNKTSKMNKISEITEDEKMSRIYDAVEKYSAEYGVDPNLVLAIIKTESNFNPDTKSSAGAMGLMQLMDFNCETYGVENPYDIEENIRGGVAHIKDYLDMFDGNLEMGLMAYNGGPGTMSKRGVKSPSDLYKMPKETQNYVPKVLNYYNDYKNRH